MNILNLPASVPLKARIDLWLEVHNIPLYADLVTYYMICALWGTIQGMITVWSWCR